MNVMTLDKDRAEYLIDTVIIPSLEVGAKESFTNFLKVLGEDDSPISKEVLKDLNTHLGPSYSFQTGHPHHGYPPQSYPPQTSQSYPEQSHHGYPPFYPPQTGTVQPGPFHGYPPQANLPQAAGQFYPQPTPHHGYPPQGTVILIIV